MNGMPEVTHEVGDVIEGFEVTQIEPLPNLQAMGITLRHGASGAEVLHVCADDAENLFSVIFRTPPRDDTGAPHILEHSVLAGSEKFPVKEPFFEMIKMSMATFINAMTGPDLTYYPVASNNRQDLFNLAEVYFDAVFHPLLANATFRREAHHLAPVDKTDPTGELTVSGIVHSEMKGAWSSPEAMLYRLWCREMFPDSIYGLSSGGEPEAIVKLTHEELRDFHKTHYDPSNALFFLYGDIPTAEYMAFLAPKLAAYQAQPAAAPTQRQPRWDSPRTYADHYPIGADEPAEEKTYLLINWIVGDGADLDDAVAIEVLERILLGHEAAPLKQAIIDSKLGQDVSHAFYNPSWESTFHVGVKGAEVDRAEPFEKLVLDTLAQIADGDIPAEWVETAFQQVAYRRLEIGPLFPLRVMGRVVELWSHRDDVFDGLKMREQLEACKRRYQRDPTLFNRLIRDRLIDNPHRLTIVLAPNRDEQARRDGAFAERMNQLRGTLTDEQARKIAADAAELEAEAGQPNSPEALAALPQLMVADLPDGPREIPTTIESIGGGVTILRNDVFANGVNYLNLSFDLAGLDAGLYEYLPRYRDAIHKLGTAGQDYAQIARRVAAHTGGVGCGLSFQTHADDADQSLGRLSLTIKTLDDQIEPALDVLGDLLFKLDPRDPARLTDVLVQADAGYRTHLVHNGMQTATSHAGRGLWRETYLDDLTRGLPQLAQTRRLLAEGEQGRDGLIERIEAIRDFLLNRNRLVASFTGTPGCYDAVCRRLAQWSGQMSNAAVTEADVGVVAQPTALREALAAPMDVAFCSAVMPASHASDPDEPLAALAARIVSLDYCLPELRFKGNAYGASCRYDAIGRTLALATYRDPHVARTLGVFAGVVDYVKSADWTQTDIDRAIIGKAKEDEAPIRPGPATEQALQRHLLGLTPKRRAARYARILAAKPAEAKDAFCAMVEPRLADANVCVVASRPKLEDANGAMSAPLAIEDILG